MINDVRQFIGEQKVFDDITLLVINKNNAMIDKYYFLKK
ncbi:hypothetical protein BGP_6130 [Beggiatoa sp. PS]|nr:hypothetical protein BGP_6130 [Beggiatoa sp. PS]